MPHVVMSMAFSHKALMVLISKEIWKNFFFTTKKRNKTQGLMYT